ncbi:hypothetical protein DF211_09270 [Pectobacterium parmentieri]|nr:hypothetical protein [Pectobacterium parmentieri]PWD64687.1 hypothetical protein DF211_09270 [Pectobacterium parmentieri]
MICRLIIQSGDNFLDAVFISSIMAVANFIIGIQNKASCVTGSEYDSGTSDDIIAVPEIVSLYLLPASVRPSTNIVFSDE